MKLLPACFFLPVYPSLTADLTDEPWRTILLVLKTPFIDDSELNIINPSGVAKARS
jgi:hypothetical protein